MHNDPPWHARPIHHIALKVADLARCEAFYHGALQYAVLQRYADAQGSPRSVWLDLGHGTILMLEKGPVAAPGGWHLVALRIDAAQREAVKEALQERGIAVTGCTAFSIYVADPEGNRLAFSHWPEKAVP